MALTLKCTQCGKQLEYFGGRHGDYGGTVCTNCKIAFCPQCKDNTRSTPCPKCSQGLLPAMQMNLDGFRG